jgi:hypothetical protein
LVCWTWASSLSAPFLFDDHSAIVRNPQIRHLGRALIWMVHPLQAEQAHHQLGPLRED